MKGFCEFSRFKVKTTFENIFNENYAIIKQDFSSIQL